MERWAEILGEATVRSLVLLAVGAGAARLARRRSAALRHALWLTVLVGMLLMPVASWLLPGLKVPVLPGDVSSAPVPATTVTTPPITATPVARDHTPMPTPINRRLWLGWMLAAGSVVLIARLVAAIAKVASVGRASRRIDDPGVQEILAGLSLGHALARIPAVCEADVRTPLVAGLLRPRILLPPTWRDWSHAKVEAVLAHECAHIARSDVFSRVLAALNRCVFWFHPGAWWLARQLEILAEEASDDLALVGRGDSHQYARMLVELAREAGSGAFPRAAIAMARPRSVPGRVDRLLDSAHQPSPGLSPAGRLLTFVAAFPLVYAVAAASLAPMQAPQPPSHEPLRLLQSKTWTNDLLGVGMRVTPMQAESLEARLRTNAHDLEARITLIAHYFWQAKTEARPVHVLWWIEHYPASRFFDFQGAHLDSHSPAEAFDEATRLWIAQASRYSNPRLLANAARALEHHRPDLSAEYLMRARQLDPDNPDWVERLVMHYIHSVGLSFVKGKLQLPPERLSFVNGAPVALESLSDAEVLLLAGERLRSGRHVRVGAEGDIRMAELGERLVRKAYSLGAPRLPDAPEPRTSPPPARAAPTRVHELRLIEHVAPIYPPLAKQARIVGKVVLDITVAPDGKLTNIKVVMGHPLLVQASLDAAKQWVYEKPFTESIVRATIPFTLGQ